MDRQKLTLHLRPLEGGAFTQASLRGALCSAPQGMWMRGLLRMLAFWSGWPVHVVLHVDRATAGWSEVWADALTFVSVGDYTVEFRVRRDEGGR